VIGVVSAWVMGCSSGVAPTPEPLGIEAGSSVEVRVADAPALVKDIWAGERPLVVESGLVKADSQAFFIGGRGGHGCAIWQTDGSEAGTRLVWAFPDQARCWDVSWMEALGDDLVFKTVYGEVFYYEASSEAAPRLFMKLCEGEGCGVLARGVSHLPFDPLPRMMRRCDQERCQEFGPQYRAAVVLKDRLFFRGYAEGKGAEDGPGVWEVKGGQVRRVWSGPTGWVTEHRGEAYMWSCERLKPCGLWRLGEAQREQPHLPYKAAPGAKVREDLRLVGGERCLTLSEPPPAGEEGVHTNTELCLKGGKLIKPDKKLAEAYRRARMTPEFAGRQEGLMRGRSMIGLR
jgi:hypothetical protein